MAVVSSLQNDIPLLVMFSLESFAIHDSMDVALPNQLVGSRTSRPQHKRNIRAHEDSNEIAFLSRARYKAYASLLGRAEPPLMGSLKPCV